MYKIKNTRLISESRISIYTKYFIVPWLTILTITIFPPLPAPQLKTLFYQFVTGCYITVLQQHFLFHFLIF
nr:MAG TPA: hypothetical protein [Caudoviricetes sp.]